MQGTNEQDVILSLCFAVFFAVKKFFVQEPKKHQTFMIK
jgi:hypothetical protein